ncbi:MAG: hypothetical protein O6951_06000, partial [Actinobacteria bacterium]|nr:hypothetical protein [Actinomycetota bacterium]
GLKSGAKGMRKAFVFIATFVAVLIAGAAFAFMATPGDEVAEAAEESAIEETTTTFVLHEEEENPPVVVDEREEPKEEEEPNKDQEKEEPEKDTTPPELVILYPEDGAHFTETHLTFEGEVEAGSKVFAAGYEADVTDDGHWRIVLILSLGGNLATFTAVDASGNEAQAQVKVYLDKTEETPKEEPKEETKEYEFTAHQKYGSCSEDVPYDVWYGTGDPGTKIWIGSEYGSNSTVIGEKGNWDLKVKFPEAPCNDEIKVVLETDDGHRKVYEFIRLCENEGGGEDHDGEEPK